MLNLATNQLTNYIKRREMKTNIISSILLTVTAIEFRNNIAIILSVIASAWIIMNQIYTTRKRVNKEFKGKWNEYIKFVLGIKKK